MVLPPILAAASIPTYYIIDLRRKVIYEHLLDPNTQAYQSHPTQIQMDDIEHGSLILQPVMIKIPFSILYHPPPFED